MSSQPTIPNFEEEETDLGLHVKLCAERYKNLDSRLNSLENKVDEISIKVDSFRQDMVKALIATAGTIVVAVIGAVVTIITKLPAH